MSDISLDQPAVFFANAREAPSLEKQPRMEVRCWRMMKSASGELHLASLRERTTDRGVFRLTSAIASIDFAAKIVSTSSGRRYELLASPERRAFEVHLLWAGVARLGLSGATDVSSWVWSRMDSDE